MTTTKTRAAATVIGAAGIALLAGCTAAPNTATADTTSSAGASAQSSASSDTTTESGTTASGAYVAGTYEAEGTYLNPRGTAEKILVDLTIDADGVISAVEVTGEATERESKQYQNQFISGISNEVVGKSIADLEVDTVAGSSLTGQGFNAALDEIRSEAAS